MIDLSKFSNDDFDRGASALKETVWVLVRLIFFAIPVPLPSGLRAFWLRTFGAEIGDGVVIRSRVNISFPWRLTIGDHAWIGEGVVILSLAPVEIGSNACISQESFLCTGSHDYEKDTFDLVTGTIRIEESSWIGARCFVGPNVTIARGGVAAAGSVVVRDVDSGTVVGGNPAIEIKRTVSN